MARLSDLPPVMSEQLLNMRDKAPRFAETAWVHGPALPQRRVAIVTTAGLHRAEDRPFTGGAGSTEYRVIPSDAPTDELVMSHLSVNFDRTGLRRDVNVVFPLDRLKELAQAGEVGSVAQYHYSFMGAVVPATRFEPKAREVAALLKRDKVDTALLIGV